MNEGQVMSSKKDNGIFVGGGGDGYGEAQQLLLEYANRHGLIAGATGTGLSLIHI